MNISSEKNWKILLSAHLHSEKDGQFFASPEIPQKIFNNAIKSYAKYVTSRGDKILALYDGGRNGKEGFSLTERGIAFKDAYGNFGGCPYEDILSFELEKGGDPADSFPIVSIECRDGSPTKISFMETPQAASILIKLLELVTEENRSLPTLPPPHQQELPLDEKWAEIIQTMLPNMPLEGLYKKPYIPERQMQIAVGSYARELVADPEEVLALFEYKTLGEEGFLLTGRSLIYNMGYENWGHLDYESLTEVDFSTQRILNNDVPTLGFHTKDGRFVELQFIIHPVIARYLHDCADKGILMNKTQKPAEKEGQQARSGGLAIAEKIQNYLPHDPANRIFKVPQIPRDLLEVFRGNFAETFTHKDEVLCAAYDGSLKGTGESGALLTDRNIYIRNSKKKVEVIPYSRIESYEIDSGRHHNNINLITTDGKAFTISFYLYKKAQDGFLHFLRQSFPGAEREKTSVPPGNEEIRPAAIVKHVYISRRTITGIIPVALVPFFLLISGLLLWSREPSIFQYLLTICWFFALLLCGFLYIGSRREYVRIARAVKRIPFTELKDALFKENEMVKTMGKARNGLYILDNKCCYAEKMAEEESSTKFQHFMGHFRKVLVLQMVPFYLEDDATRLLVLTGDSMVGLFQRNDGLISPGDSLHICGFTVKNPFPKEFPDAEYALTGGKGPDDIPLAISDSGARLGSSPHENRAALMDMAAGYSCIGLGILGELMLYFWTTIAHQKGFELILNLFT
jgi:hypothetical protein